MGYKKSPWFYSSASWMNYKEYSLAKKNLPGIKKILFVCAFKYNEWVLLEYSNDLYLQNYAWVTSSYGAPTSEY